MSDLWVPITIFLSLSLVTVIKLWLDNKYKESIQKTIRAALDHGNELTPNFLESLGVSDERIMKNLKRSVFLFMVAAAIVVAGSILDIGKPAFAIATFPLFLSISFGIIHKLEQKSKADI